MAFSNARTNAISAIREALRQRMMEAEERTEDEGSSWYERPAGGAVPMIGMEPPEAALLRGSDTMPTNDWEKDPKTDDFTMRINMPGVDAKSIHVRAAGK